MSFRVQLDAFRGPLDLLVFLARQDEIDLSEVEVAAIVRQYLDYLPTPEKTADAVANLSEVGDFLEAASTLLEMKARLVLPADDDSNEPQVEDPHDELVQRLLDYKRYKDAAVVLEEHGAAWRERYSRAADDFPARRSDPAHQPLHEIELWDLVSALGRVLRDNQPSRAANIIYDDTPLSVHMRRVTELVGRQGGASFSELFQAGMHKSTMIGLFLAVLELVRSKRVRAEQEGLHTEIRILPDEQFAAAWEEDAAAS